MEILAIILVILILLPVFMSKSKPVTVTDEQLMEQEKELKKKEEDLARIYWHISEIERLSNEKTKAIRAGDMELYKKLADEHDALNRLYKIEFPNK